MPSVPIRAGLVADPTNLREVSSRDRSGAISGGAGVSITGRSAPDRLVLLSVLAAVIGLLGGGAAWVLVHLIAGITNVALFHRLSWTLPSSADLDRGPNLVVVAVLGGLV